MRLLIGFSFGIGTGALFSITSGTSPAWVVVALFGAGLVLEVIRRVEA